MARAIAPPRWSRGRSLPCHAKEWISWRQAEGRDPRGGGADIVTIEPAGGAEIAPGASCVRIELDDGLKRACRAGIVPAAIPTHCIVFLPVQRNGNEQEQQHGSASPEQPEDLVHF